VRWLCRARRRRRHHCGRDPCGVFRSADTGNHAIDLPAFFSGGRPVFTADREHIHHKLLQRGFSHRQVVILLYGVSALFALLSLFLLWPRGDMLGLVLAVLGAAFGLACSVLGYLEFGELGRVAHRTMRTGSD